jgi:DNA polymerase III subunit alpha
VGDSFVHLHVHTEYSMLDGASRVDGLMAKAAQQGMPAVAITDHGNMFGAIDFFKAGRKHGVKPILGSEIYMAPASRFTKGNRKQGRGEGAEGAGGRGSEGPYYHLTLLAENQRRLPQPHEARLQGLREGYWYKPRVDKELLAEHSEGLIALSGCLGAEVNQLLLAGNDGGARRGRLLVPEVFGDRYFIELQDHDIPEQHATNGRPHRARRRAERVGLVVTNDSHYTEQADYEAHDALLCVQTGSQEGRPGPVQVQRRPVLREARRADARAVPRPPRDLANTLLIAERCNVEIDFGRHLPKFECPEGHEREGVPAQEGRRGRGAPVRRCHCPLEAVDRLEYELGVIEQMGFSAYFLIVADLCDTPASSRHPRRPGPRVGRGLRGRVLHGHHRPRPARARAAVRAVPQPRAHLDARHRHGLRRAPPRRDDPLRHREVRRGHVAQIVTFSTIKAKQAIKDAARVLGYPYAFGDRLTKMMPPPVQGKDSRSSRRGEQSGELREAWENEPDAKKVIDTALGLEGLRRQHSIHAAGVVIAGSRSPSTVPILKVEADGEIVTQYDGGMVEDIGLLKMDFLGLRNLTVISDALRHIEMTTGEEVVDRGPPLDDAADLRDARQGRDRRRVPAGVRRLQGAVPPAQAGPVRRHHRARRAVPAGADGRGAAHRVLPSASTAVEAGQLPHPDVTEILEPSYGLLIYQEQVQKIAQKIAGFSLGRPT